MTTKTYTEAHPITDQKRLVLTVYEAAELLDVNPQTIRNLAKTPGFPCYRNGRRILIPKAAFVEWLNSQHA